MNFFSKKRHKIYTMKKATNDKTQIYDLKIIRKHLNLYDKLMLGYDAAHNQLIFYNGLYRYRYILTSKYTRETDMWLKEQLDGFMDKIVMDDSFPSNL